MNGAVEVRKPPVAADVSIFEFGSVAASADKVTLAGFSDATTDPPPSPADIFSRTQPITIDSHKNRTKFPTVPKPNPSPPADSLLPETTTRHGRTYGPKVRSSPPYHHLYLSDPSQPPYQQTTTTACDHIHHHRPKTRQPISDRHAAERHPTAAVERRRQVDLVTSAASPETSRRKFSANCTPLSSCRCRRVS
ncbi:hypothetical protein PHJA_000867500 [Phtheirospermum japonicum]|uniref:Uncharacterized protein n=1 Tax=Phtheirospermum japonicum TaxID=374723 RepID=A0A830BQI2_9LAMI|nr:hypothetical protein PHJA_000867500 [Phtheirospermum japonicum]